MSLALVVFGAARLALLTARHDGENAPRSHPPRMVIPVSRKRSRSDSVPDKCEPPGLRDRQLEAANQRITMPQPEWNEIDRQIRLNPFGYRCNLPTAARIVGIA